MMDQLLPPVEQGSFSGPPLMSRRFRSFLPVVIDVETGGFNCATDALLEIAAVMIRFGPDGRLHRGESHSYHVRPFEGSNIEAASLAVNGIDPYHPLRPALPEKDALGRIFTEVRAAMKAVDCRRAVLVGHNAAFDLGFLNAAVARADIKRNPFHPFSCFDTATLAGAAFGQTVLAKAAQVCGLDWDSSEAHSAKYDAERTADIFCEVCNALDSVWRRAEARAQSIRDLDQPVAPPSWSARRAGFGQELLELAAAMHVEHDVAAADQFTVHVQLGVGRPVREFLERFAQLGILEDVHGMKRIGAVGAQRGDRLRREPALRKIRCALHEKHRRVGADVCLDPADDVFCHLDSPLLEHPYECPLCFRAHRGPGRNFPEGPQTTRAATVFG